MTDSRASRRFIPFFGAAAVALAGFQPAAIQHAWAQGSPPPVSAPQPLAPPTALSPQQQRSSSPAPVIVTPAPEPSFSIGQGQMTPQDPTRVQVDQLQGIDPDSVGTLTAQQGGFGIDMWSSTGRRTIEILLPELPVKTSSLAMRSISRRLLLSIATVPPRGDDSISLLGARVERLAAMGEIAGVDALLRSAPNRAIDEVLLQQEVDLYFLTNDNARACPLVRDHMTADAGIYWQKAFIFCQALAGEHDKAALGVSLLRDLGHQDPVFFGLIDKLAGNRDYRIASLVNPSPLNFAMTRAARARLPEDVIKSDNPAVLRTIATSPNARPEVRVEAAERAEAMGALPTNVLQQLYAGVTVGDEALANAQNNAETNTPLGRALLYRKALVEAIPTTLAQLLNRAYEMAWGSGRFEAAARVYSDIFGRLSPRQDLVWFAPMAVRAAVAAGNNDAAERWLAVLRTASVLDQKAAAELGALGPMIRIAGLETAEALDGPQLEGWWDRQKDQKPKEERKADNAGSKMMIAAGDAAGRAALLYNLLEAFGDQVPAERWEPLLEGSPQVTAVVPRPAIWRSLADAAQNGRIGETVLLSLLSLGQEGPAGADPVVLHRVVAGLYAVGLEAEARDIALEAAIAAKI